MKSDILSDHLKIDRYGDFLLTDAIRPSLKRQVVPTEGYRLEVYRDTAQRLEVPVLAAAVSRERLFDAFVDLLGELGDVADVVLETSHDGDGRRHRDLLREHIDMPVLLSHLYDFEDLLLHDGCTGIAVMSSTQPMEVQFDEHKLLVVYAEDLAPFERSLGEYDIRRNDQIKLITEGEHLHNTTAQQIEQFDQMCYRLGVNDSVEPVNWRE